MDELGRPGRHLSDTLAPMAGPAPVVVDDHRAEAGTVLRSGKLFEAGDYPDKGIALDETALDAAVAAFEPVDTDLEHVPTVLNGKLGRLERVWRDGAALCGTLALPQWLDTLIGGEPIKVSLAFDRLQKAIVGCALVLRPRIADAAVMSAFTAATGGPSGTASSRGAGGAERTKTMKLKDAIQRFFGLDRVDDMEAEVTVPAELSATAEQIPAPASMSQPAVAEVAVSAMAETDGATRPAAAPMAAVADPEKEALRAQVAALTARAVTQEAAAFADDIIRARKALPAQRAAIVQMVAAAGGGPGAAGFAAGVFDRDAFLTSLKAFFDAAPAHALVGEAISLDPLTTALLAPLRGGATPDKARVNTLLAMTPLGQSTATGKE